jgi:hypothetical protein
MFAVSGTRNANTVNEMSFYAMRARKIYIRTLQSEMPQVKNDFYTTLKG